MTRTIGDYNAGLTKAIKTVARLTEMVSFTDHALDEMDNDGFDVDDVMTCLRRGSAHGPELREGEVRANVLHRGLQIRVVAALKGGDGTSVHFDRIRVITVMRSL